MMSFSSWRVPASRLMIAISLLWWDVGFPRAIAPSRLVETVDLSSPTISPDGRRVAFRAEWASIERNRNESAWYVQELDGSSRPRRVGDGGFPLRNSAGSADQPVVSWSPDGRYIYYLAMVDERLDVWRAAADGGGAEPVTLDPADVRDFILGEDGRVLRYSVGATRRQVIEAEQDEYERGIRLDASVPVVGALMHSSRTRGRAASPRYSNAGFDRRQMLFDTPDRWREIDLETRMRSSVLSPEKPITAEELMIPEGTPAPTRVERDPRSGRFALLLPTQKGKGTSAEGRVDLAMKRLAKSGYVIRCHAEACLGQTIPVVQWRPGTDDVLFVTTDRENGRRQSIFRWDVAQNRVTAVVRSEGLLNGGRGLPPEGYAGQAPCGLTRDALVCVAAEANRPPRLERIEIDSGERRVLYAPNAALDSDLQEAVSAELFHWASDDGREFSGYLFQARASEPKRHPLVINYYNCDGFLRGGGTGNEWPFASLVSAGISALCVNSLPYNTDPVVRYGEGTKAVKSIVRLLGAKGVIDPSKVGMGGLSFGSEVALWTTMNSDLLATASLSSPFASPMWYSLVGLRGEVAFAPARANWGLGAPEETPEQWKKLSPVFNLERIKIPLLFQMAEEEYGYSLDYIIPLVRRQQAEAYIFPEEAHQKFQPRHLAAVYERNLDWFRFWLTGEEDDVPSKVAQYRNWHAMKASRTSISAGPPVDAAAE